MKNTLTYERQIRYAEDFVGPPEWDPGTEVVTVEAEWVICDLCLGQGSYVNPSIDGCGLTPNDFEEDLEFEQAYFNGIYDIPCHQCGGSGKMLQPVDADEWRLWQHEREWQAAEDAAERRLAARENGDWESYCSAGDRRWG